MKKVALLVSAATIGLMMSFVSSCNKEETPEKEQQEEKTSAPEYTIVTQDCFFATFNVSATVPSKKGKYFLGIQAATEDPKEAVAAGRKTNKVYETVDGGKVSSAVVLKELIPETNYKVRAYYSSSDGKDFVWGKLGEMTTPAFDAYIVEAADIATYSATIKGRIIATSGISFNSVDVIYMAGKPSVEEMVENGTRTAVTLAADGSFSIPLTSLSSKTEYSYVVAMGLYEDTVIYSSIQTFTTSKVATNFNGHAYVDLGLSVYWATINVGASKREDFGDYFAWGETTPYGKEYITNYRNYLYNGKTSYKKTYYGFDTYMWCQGTDSTINKYCTDEACGTVDGKTQLEYADDAAYLAWQGTWRMPTEAEFNELLSKCTYTWTAVNGVYGYKFTSKVKGYEDKYIFLPAAGERVFGNLKNESEGYYYSREIMSSSPKFAYALSFTSSLMRIMAPIRAYGCSIRPVTE